MNETPSYSLESNAVTQSRILSGGALGSDEALGSDAALDGGGYGS